MKDQNITHILWVITILAAFLAVVVYCEAFTAPRILQKCPGEIPGLAVTVEYRSDSRRPVDEICEVKE